jgi:hypothetical protein
MTKLVQATRGGFWDGHRRREGSIFPVADGDKAAWFEDVGPAPEGTELPTQLDGPVAPPPRSFNQAMKELSKGRKKAAPVDDLV